MHDLMCVTISNKIEYLVRVSQVNLEVFLCSSLPNCLILQLLLRTWSNYLISYFVDHNSSFDCQSVTTYVKNTPTVFTYNSKGDDMFERIEKEESFRILKIMDIS
jgi:hypothetical protein